MLFNFLHCKAIIDNLVDYIVGFCFQLCILFFFFCSNMSLRCQLILWEAESEGEEDYFEDST